ncbi:hypothetical protein [Aureitalea marina]|uniref:Uncharacterized protein n=1 Tax=Aureitalea marina TaxID=930804 RepID=A0A2S7KNJ6_9FLAO|nr:hypothetical protein [Aureitalea marina]PQB04206.1 hypothetical protein BST85_04275 [Aureitalea marina]
MRYLIVILFLLPLTGFGQYDFENRFLKLEANTLPAIESISSIGLYKGVASSYASRLKSFQMSAQNYRQPVDMMTALEGQSSFIKQDYDLSYLQQQFYGFETEGYQSDGATRVKNEVYQEMRGLNLVNSCPPTGICARCAPYRLGRGF